LADRGFAQLHSERRSAVCAPYFETGRASFYLADCMDWMDECATKSIHGIVTDPPYGLVEYSNLEQRKLRKGVGGVWRIPPSFDGHQRSPLPRFTTLSDAEIDNLEEFFRQFGRRAHRILAPGGHLLVASNPVLSHHVSHSLYQSGF